LGRNGTGVDVDVLVFGEDIERGYAIKSTYTRLLVSAFFAFVVHDRPVIDPYCSRFNVLTDAPRSIHISRPNAGREPKFGLVGQHDGFGFGVEYLNGGHGTKGLLADDIGVPVRDFQESRSIEGTDSQRPFFDDTAANKDLRSRLDRVLNGGIDACD